MFWTNILIAPNIWSLSFVSSRLLCPRRLGNWSHCEKAIILNQHNKNLLPPIVLFLCHRICMVDSCFPWSINININNIFYLFLIIIVNWWKNKNKIEKLGILMLCDELNSMNIISMLYMIIKQMFLAFDVI